MSLNEIRLYRMTHIENVPHILQYGITNVSSKNKNLNFVPIGDASLISTRSNFLLPNGDKLGDYIPFYFGNRSPMLYVITKGFNGVAAILSHEIVYVLSNVQKIMDAKLYFLFSDGHPIESISTIFNAEQAENIPKLVDFKAVEERFWNQEVDVKRKKQAEFLVKNDIPYAAISFFVVQNQAAKFKLLAWNVPENQVFVRSGFYF
jgi:ssDNA thymidine ADP-ribosyltransferase, DarT